MNLILKGDEIGYISDADDQSFGMFCPISTEEVFSEIVKLREELETERMRLAACGVVALANTPDSAMKARDMLPQYKSASCDDVARIVDSEMKLRAELATLVKQPVESNTVPIRRGVFVKANDRHCMVVDLGDDVTGIMIQRSDWEPQRLVMSPKMWDMVYEASLRYKQQPSIEGKKEDKRK